MLTVDLTGRRAVVTGGNSGIGEAVALTLTEAGADVAINYIVNPDQAEAVAARVREKGRKSLSVKADVTDEADVASMFSTLDREWGGVDILVNNAGIDGKRMIGWEAELSEWRKVMDVNLFGSFNCCHQALKRMIPAGKGVILNMSSVHETIPWSGYSAYTASKAAISMLTRTLAQEAAPHGVRVTALAPGAIKTPINKDVWSNPKSLRDLLEKIPLGRVGEPEDIARMAAVLVSDLAGYATGMTLFVDGGMTDYPDFSHGG